MPKRKRQRPLLHKIVLEVIGGVVQAPNALPPGVVLEVIDRDAEATDCYEVIGNILVCSEREYVSDDDPAADALANHEVMESASQPQTTRRLS